MDKYENWDPYEHYLVAKDNCGLQESENQIQEHLQILPKQIRTYTLHTYLCYLKFGFGRATQDAGIEIRRGAISREQAINLVKLYDGLYPHEYIETYLDYYKMNKNEFDKVLDHWANKEILKRKMDFGFKN